MSKISIIVPVYNVEKYLRACLDSILAQTYTNWEAVLVDDGSADRSGAICDEYAACDSRFVVVHKQNEGVAKARITAFEHSKGELITFIDADDYVTPDYLEKLSKPILEQDADMVSCDYYKVEKGELIEPRGKLTGTYEKEQIKDFIANHYFYDKTTNGYGMTCFLCTKMVRREYVLKGLEQGVGMWFGEDQVSMFAILLQCGKLVLIPDRLYHYIQHDGQAVKRYDESLWENIIQLLEQYQSMHPTGLSQEGLRRRTWLYIKKTMQEKMIPSSLDKRTFVNQMSNVRQFPYMKKFFRPATIGFGWKNEIVYWLLKLCRFRILYTFLVFLQVKKEK